jgi:hypothetical protein
MLGMRDLNTHHKKTTISVIITLALVVLTGATAGVLGILNARDDAPVQKAATTQKNEVRPATTVRFTAIADKTVLEQLRTQAGEVTVKDSSYGEYVEAIDGLKGGTDNKYWTYYVNGQMANIGAGEYVAKGGEEIVWKFE